MRRRSRDSRGLAEIVGTLMLVVIVVAAATAFSFFVAAYQKQVQAEETVVHDRALENLKFISLSSDGCALYDGATHSCATPLPNDEFAEVTVEVASLDINGIGVTGVYLAGHPVVNYSVVIGHSTYTPCFDSTNKTSIPCQAVALPPYAEPRFIFNLDNDTDFSAASSCGGSRVLDCLYAFGTPFDSTAISASHELVLDLLTSLGNSFVGTFVPPVAKFGVTYVDSWPILDGSGSYQPSGGVTTNASIDQWGWSVHTNSVDQDNGNYSGQQTELPAPLVPGATYFINLTVTNALGLVGTAREVYVAPGQHVAPVAYSVTFSESTLPSGTRWSVELGGISEHTIGNSITFNATDGTFGFTVGTVTGYDATPPDGLVTVSGGAVGEAISFGPS